VNSYLSEDFIKFFGKLPKKVQERAKNSYRKWKENPSHPGIQFKKVHPIKPVYSVRVSLGWRALGYKEGDKMLWFWIGSHESYNKLVSQL